jgi:hypothetical protein
MTIPAQGGWRPDPRHIFRNGLVLVVWPIWQRGGHARQARAALAASLGDCHPPEKQMERCLLLPNGHRSTCQFVWVGALRIEQFREQVKYEIMAAYQITIEEKNAAGAWRRSTRTIESPSARDAESVALDRLKRGQRIVDVARDPRGDRPTRTLEHF